MSGGAKAGLLSVLLVIVFVAVVWDRGGDADIARTGREEIDLPEKERAVTARAPTRSPVGLLRRGLEISAAPELMGAAPVAAGGAAVAEPPRDLGPGRDLVEEIAKIYDPEPRPVPPAPVESSKAPPAPKAIPSLREHTVSKGQTLWSIAARAYGNGNLWTRIRDANVGRLPDPDRVREGDRIVIPAAGARIAPTTETKTPALVATPPAPRIHVVQKGETLFRIARTTLGEGKHWKRIAEANPGRVSPSGDVAEGTRLVIPAIVGKR